MSGNIKASLHFSTSDGCDNWMRCECSDEGTPWSTHTQKIHYSSTCSHAAEGEIAAKIASVNMQAFSWRLA